MAESTKAQNPLARKPLTQDRLKELLHYDPETGIFTWIATKAHRVKNGDQAGTIKVGCKCGSSYIIINLDYCLHRAHRLAWLYMFGEYAPDYVDHIDGNGLNNKIKNLRGSTNSQNLANRGKNRNSTSGVKGVCWSKERNLWLAQITVNCKSINLGRFRNIEDAAKAYAEAANKYFGKFARTE